QDALVPVAIGLIIAGGLDLAQAAHRGWLTIAISAASMVSILKLGANPIWTLLTSAAVALAAHYSGLVSLA
ncbi:MAG: hypothetical protein WCP99_12100, partial [Burkholderiales bacterium]